MNANRLWVIGSVTVMIVAVLAGWFLGIEPNLAAAAAADTERTGIETQNTAKVAEIAALTEENKDLSSIDAEYQALQRSIPTSPSTASFITGLDKLAESTGVQVAGITVGAPQAYTVPQSAVPAAPVPTDGATPTPTATAAPAAPTGYVAATSPLITPENFVGINVGVDLKGTYQAVLSFVKGLQSNDRLVLVTGFSSVADADTGGSDVTAHVDGLIYVLKKA
jgi:Tfp pilus assembly protein PilO